MSKKQEKLFGDEKMSQKPLQRLFTNDTFFLVVTILSIAGLLPYAVDTFAGFFASGSMRLLTMGLTLIVCCACILTLYLSYLKHNKNIMKPMMGALLMALLMDSFSYISSDLPVDRILTPIYVLLSLALFINHMVINGTRRARPTAIALNRIIVFMLVLLQTVWTCVALSTFISGAWHVIGNIAYIFGYSCMAASIVCIESRLDAYRLDREAAGWTEEAGYPEGYVHNCGKKK